MYDITLAFVMWFSTNVPENCSYICKTINCYI